MRRFSFALLFGLLWTVLLVLGVSGQTEPPPLPVMPELPLAPRQQPFTIPPLELPTGATITVTTTADELDAGGDCSLREAIQAANSDTAVGGCPAGDGEDLILLAAGTYRLALEGRSEDDNTTGDLDVRSSLMISGTGAEGTIVDAEQIDRVLHVHEGAVVELRGLTLRNGRAPDGLESGCRNEDSTTCAGEPGGGIANNGRLLLVDSFVTKNRSGDGDFCAHGGNGGGIFNTGVLSVIAATLADNGTGPGGYCGRGYAPAGHGGGIANRGDLTIADSHIIGNFTADYGSGGGLSNEKDMLIMTSTIAGNRGRGGGIFNTGRLTIGSSTVHSNASVSEGGGIYNRVALSMINSTISGNRSGNGTNQSTIPGPSGHPFSPGQGKRGGGIFNSGWLHLESSTIAANTTGVGSCQYFSGVSVCAPGGSGGGLANEDGSVTVHNSIIAQNTTGKGGPNFDCLGPVTDRGHNLMCRFGLNHSTWLAPLADNGGPTPTHALLPYSAALNAGTCSTLVGNFLVEDQRGEPRPQGDTCDIGAFESPLATVALTNTLYFPLVADELYFKNVVQDCSPDEHRTILIGATAVDGLLQAHWGYDMVYSDAPDGSILNRQRLPSSTFLWTVQFTLREDGPLAGDWYMWLVNEQDRRISEIAHVHTHGESGEDTCQVATLLFRSN